MNKETTMMEIVEEARNDVLLEGSDNEGRARFVYRFFHGDDRGINETKDKEYLNVFRGCLRFRAAFFVCFRGSRTSDSTTK